MLPTPSAAPASHLDGHVVDIEAEGDALVEGQLGLTGRIDINHLLGLDVALLVVDAGLNDTIPDGLQAPKGTQSHQEAHLLNPRTPVLSLSSLHSHTLTRVHILSRNLLASL